jgi:hypothetical protein
MTPEKVGLSQKRKHNKRGGEVDEPVITGSQSPIAKYSSLDGTGTTHDLTRDVFSAFWVFF